jgi:trehalose-phosphatase
MGLAATSLSDGHLADPPFLTFFSRLRSCRNGILILDYDGTLAPFTVRRDQARPYVQVPFLLDCISAATETRVVIVSGRGANSVRKLLKTSRPLEIWGSHGVERIHRSGEVERVVLAPHDLAVLGKVANALEKWGLGNFVERKPGSVAVHWRGMTRQGQHELESKALELMSAAADDSRLSVLRFEAGIELRVPEANKAHAVRAILRDCDSQCVAYIGDDVTDEDAFEPVNHCGGLSVLMRPEHRPTAAQAWLRTPAQLFAFLREWLISCTGEAL